jgi:hypothetical protein
MGYYYVIVHNPKAGAKRRVESPLGRLHIFPPPPPPSLSLSALSFCLPLCVCVSTCPWTLCVYAHVCLCVDTCVQGICACLPVSVQVFCVGRCLGGILISYWASRSLTGPLNVRIAAKPYGASFLGNHMFDVCPCVPVRGFMVGKGISDMEAIVLHDLESFTSISVAEPIYRGWRLRM